MISPFQETNHPFQYITDVSEAGEIRQPDPFGFLSPEKTLSLIGPGQTERNNRNSHSYILLQIGNHQPITLDH